MLNPSLADIARETDQQQQLDVVLSASGFNNLHQDGFYGVHDLPEQEAEHDLLAVGINGLQVSTSAAMEQKHVVGTVSKTEPQLVQRQAASEQETQQRSEQVDTDIHSTECANPSTTINKSLIETRVRRQRSNQAKRRQLAKRNIVKDSQKRKLKSEVEGGIWY
ncbi:hypothetical protein FGB62_16g164 [Gracilaria domingensis]|nr:hypothetical protein FGB62_16g164 [Gracilaria domingensis]